MATYTERVQTVLTKEQYDELLDVAEQRQKPVSVLIREAIEETYFVEVERRRRQRALNQILTLDAPTADWEQMEEEIARGAIM